MSITTALLPGKKIRNSQLFSGGIFILILLAIAIIWFFLVHSVRIKELRYRLKTSTDQNSSVRTLSLVSRYQLLRRGGYESEGAANYAREGRVMQILADTAYLNESDDLNWGEYAAKITVDFFDLISGSPPFQHDKSSREHRIVERAFYHEITRTYREAIVQYDAALNQAAKITQDMRAYALLHRGFCKALANERPKAADDFREVLATGTDAEYIETAKILLTMVTGIERDITQINALPLSKQKATAYYNLTAYDQAIDNFRKIASTQSDPEALFYLARSLEETGNTRQAIEQYRKAIAVNANTPWAVKANRRIFALGAFYAAGKEYRTESKANVEKGIIRDKDLLKEAERFSKVSEQIDQGERQTVAAILGAPEATGPVNSPMHEATGQALSDAADRAQDALKAAKENQGPDWAKLELLPRAEKISYINKHSTIEKIMLENGNEFRGLIISESKDRLFLFTALGRVAIYKAQIESRKTAAP